MNYDDYQALLNQFLDGAVSSRAFQHRYLEKIKNEKRRFPETVFRVLDSLFADVDAFCPDEGLLAQLSEANPDYYLNEQTLRQRVSAASEQLRQLASMQAQPQVH